MQKRALGASGIEASVIALGTWSFGGWMWGGQSDAEAVNAVCAAIDHGVNFIDTAPMYAFGKSEEIVGKAIKNCRDKLVIATKCGLRWDCAKGQHFFNTDLDNINNSGRLQVYRYLNAKSIREEIENSLRRLGTDYIDLYQTHWQDPTTPIEDTMAELLKLKEEGKIRAVGASNCTLEELKSYTSCGVLDVDQEQFSMLDRAMEQSGQLKYCFENNIAFLAYSPLAQGLLTGKITVDREFSESDQRASNPRFSKANRSRVLAMLEQFNSLASDYHATTAQLVMAWSLQQQGCTHLLTGARHADQAIENAAAGMLQLKERDLAFIDEVCNSHLTAIV